MASEDRNLRRLAKRARISFQPPGASDRWPLTHRSIFEEVQSIRNLNFDSYCAGNDVESSQEPWKRSTKHLAVWLAKRTCQLTNQQRNEAGWRFGIENAILQRFNFEVAW